MIDASCHSFSEFCWSVERRYGRRSRRTPRRRKAASEVKKPEAAATAKPEQSVTEHTIKVGGAVLKYKATAGTL